MHEAPNQLTLVTANQEPWSQRLWPHIERADQDRVGPPHPLQGLNRAQAAELAALRLELHVEPARREAFLSAKWLQGLFHESTRSVPVPFLQRCRERWHNAPAERPSLA